MQLEKGQTTTFKTQSFGDVKVWNDNDKALHFYYTHNREQKNGFLNIETGSVSNVPQRLVNEILSQL